MYKRQVVGRLCPQRTKVEGASFLRWPSVAMSFWWLQWYCEWTTTPLLSDLSFQRRGRRVYLLRRELCRTENTCRPSCDRVSRDIYPSSQSNGIVVPHGLQLWWPHCGGEEGSGATLLLSWYNQPWVPSLALFRRNSESYMRPQCEYVREQHRSVIGVDQYRMNDRCVRV